MDILSLREETPGDAPRRKQSEFWGPLSICRTFVDRGLVQRFEEMLTRIEAVPKSAFSIPADQPTAKMHFDSFAANSSLANTMQSIIVIDDVATRGATLLAAVSRVKTIHPEADVVGFAVLRAISEESSDDAFAPVIGSIKLDSKGNCRRRP